MLGQRVIARDVSRYKVYQSRQGYVCKIEVEKAKQIVSGRNAAVVWGYFITV